MRRVLTLLIALAALLVWPAAASAAAYDHIVLIVFENHPRSAVTTPTFTSFAQQNASDTNYFAVGHPSLPNYIALTSGSTQGITDDKGPSAHPLKVANIFAQLGTQAQSLEESMPSNCYKSDSGKYAVRHNPEAYYLNAPCSTMDKPLPSTLNLSPKFTFVTPNLCDDAHDCSLSIADTWLANFLPKARAALSGHWAIVVTFDEGNSSSNNVYLAVQTDTGANAHITTLAKHPDLLAAIEQQLGVAVIGPGSSSKLAPLFGGSTSGGGGGFAITSATRTAVTYTSDAAATKVVLRQSSGYFKVVQAWKQVSAGSHTVSYTAPAGKFKVIVKEKTASGSIVQAERVVQ